MQGNEEGTPQLPQVFGVDDETSITCSTIYCIPFSCFAELLFSQHIGTHVRKSRDITENTHQDATSFGKASRTSVHSLSPTAVSRAMASCNSEAFARDDSGGQRHPTRHVEVVSQSTPTSCDSNPPPACPSHNAFFCRSSISFSHHQPSIGYSSACARQGSASAIDVCSSLRIRAFLESQISAISPVKGSARGWLRLLFAAGFILCVLVTSNHTRG